LLIEELHDMCIIKDIIVASSKSTRYAKREIHRGNCKYDYAKRVLVRKRKGRRTIWKACMKVEERK
jgi:hypothetical protein